MIEWLLEIIQMVITAVRTIPLSHLGVWNYVIIAVLTAIEGPFVALIGATVASTAGLRPVLIFIAAAVGNLVSDLIWYAIGYTGKVDWALRYGHWLGIREEHIERLRQSMRQHAPRILLVAKVSAGFAIPSFIAAGLARAPWRRWLPGVVVVEALRTGSLVLAGYYFTSALAQVERGMQIVILIATLSFVVLVMWWYRTVRRSPTLIQEPTADDA